MRNLGLFLLLILELLLPTCVNAKVIKVACVGNSITYGYGLADRDHESYPARLQLLLGKGFEVRNFGHSGCTLLRHGHHPYISEPEYKAALNYAADIIVIHLGVNDTDPRNWPNYADEFNHDYSLLIDSLRSHNPKAKVWICLMTPLTFRHHRFLSGTRDWHQQIQEHIRQIAINKKTGLIDLFSPLYKRPDLFIDAVHPNAEGAGIMACEVYSAITGNYGGLKLPLLYTDGMVIQREEPIVLHGLANSGEKINLNFNGEFKGTAIADHDGKWEFHVPALKAGGPYTITISSPSMSVILHDVWVGDVWLCSGQSNMEMPVAACKSAVSDIKEANKQTLLHIYNMHTLYNTWKEKWSEQGCDSVNKLQILQHKGWETVDSQSIRNFSAIAYHFGRTLSDSLQVPIGIICNAVGGTTTESWVGRHTLEWEFPNILFDWYHNDFGQPWARQRALYNVSLSKAQWQRHPFEPAYMFEAGILPLEQYNIKGVCWYQGESNAHNIETHAKLFTLLEKSWREYFKKPELPFYTVQLSSLNRPSWPYFRNSQRLLADSLSHTFMVVTTDLGDSLNVHYPQKRQVGERLAWQALKNTYNHNLEWEGPVCIEKTVIGDKILLRFSHADGLHAKGPLLKGFDISGDDGIYYPAEAFIEGDKVSVSCKKVRKPKYIRYGWQPFSTANLFNGKDLPASTFKL